MGYINAYCTYKSCIYIPSDINDQMLLLMDAIIMM